MEIDDFLDEWWADMLPEERPTCVTTMEIATDVLKHPPEQVEIITLMRIGMALRKLGFSRTRRMRDGSFISAYVHRGPKEPILRSVT